MSVSGEGVSMNTEKKYPQRTLTQNAALHIYFKLISDALNNAGLDMRKVLKPGVDIPWSPKMVKEYIWRSVQKAQLGKRSTTELSTADIDKVFDVINRHLGEKFGIHEDWPSIKAIMWKMRQNERPVYHNQARATKNRGETKN